MGRGRSRAAATSRMECFVIIVNGWKPLTIITKHSILDVAATLDPTLMRDRFDVTFNARLMADVNHHELKSSQKLER